MIIEFMGTPGAGKSTLQGTLMRALQDAGVDVVSATGKGELAPGRHGPAHRLALYGAAAWSSRAVLRHASRLLLRSPRRWREKLFALRLLVVALARYRIARDVVGTRVVMMDEGFLQRCFMLLIDGPSKPPSAEIRRLVSSGPHADVVLHVHAPAETALRRVSRRARQLPPRLQDLCADDLRTTFRVADELFVEMAQVIQLDRDHPALVIATTSDDVDDACAAVVGAMGAAAVSLAGR